MARHAHSPLRSRPAAAPRSLAVERLCSWHGVEIRHLEALAAVAHTGSFHRAARSLGYSQSAVSKHVQLLERAIGHQLVRRPEVGAALGLTPAGEIVLRHAEALRGRLAAAEAELASLGDEVDALRIGVTDTAGHVVARALPRLRSGVDAQVRVFVADDAELAQALADAEIDLALVQDVPPDGPFAVEKVAEEDYVLLVPAAPPYASWEQAGPKELARVTLVRFGATSRIERAARRHLEQSGVAPRSVVTVDDISTARELVAAGAGAAIVPRLGIDPADARVRAVTLVDAPRRTLAAVYAAQPAPVAITGVVEALRAAARELRCAAGG